MNTLQEWAEFYKELRVWVYPFNDYYESFEWKHWRNTEEQGYEDEFKTYNWNAAKGINIVTGKKGVIVLRFPKDEDIRYANNSLSNVLSVLGLPHDYDWVIESETTLSVLIDVSHGARHGVIWEEMVKSISQRRVECFLCGFLTKTRI